LQPLLYQVATDELAPTEVGFPIRELLHGRKNIVFHQAAVRSVDLARKEVVAEGIGPVHYDYLIVALGAVVNFFRTPGADRHAFPLYTTDDAVRLKEHILRTFEAADKNPALVEKRGRDTMINLPGLILCAGRPEIAGLILETFAKYVSQGRLPNNFPNVLA